MIFRLDKFPMFEFPVLGVSMPLGAACIRVGLGLGGTYSHTHMHARQGCQVCGLVRVANGLVQNDRVAKRVAPIPHATKHKQLSWVYTTTAHVGVPIPPCDVCVVP